MVADHQLGARVGMGGEGGVEPFGLDMALAAEPRPEGMHEHHQQVAAAHPVAQPLLPRRPVARQVRHDLGRSEEHTSELQSLMRISYAVFCLKTKKKTTLPRNNINTYPTPQPHH